MIKSLQQINDECVARKDAGDGTAQCIAQCHAAITYTNFLYDGYFMWLGNVSYEVEAWIRRKAVIDVED